MARFPSDVSPIVVSVDFRDRKDRPARVDGVPTWELLGDSIGDLVVDTNGLGATFTPNGTLGTATLNVAADADLDEGETRELHVSGQIEIAEAEAFTGTINFVEGSPTVVLEPVPE